MNITTIIHVSLACSFAFTQCMELTPTATLLVTDTCLQKLITHMNQSSHIVTILKEHAQQKNIELVPRNIKTLFPALKPYEIDDMFLAHVEDNELRPLLFAMGAHSCTRNQNGQNCLWYTRQPKLLEELIDRGANVNAQDSSGRTPLINVIEKELTDIVECLLQNKTDANTPDKYGNYPIHYAMTRKDDVSSYLHSPKKIIPLIVILLLQHNADPNKPYPHSSTMPLHVAVERNQSELIKELLNHGAEKHHPDQYGRTAYQLAQSYGHSQEILDLLFVEPLKNEHNKNPKILTFSMTDFQEKPQQPTNGYRCVIQ